MPPSWMTAPSSAVAPMPTKARHHAGCRRWMMQAVADGDVVADDGLLAAGVDVDDGAVLDVRAGADADVVGVTAQHAVEPDTDFGPTVTSPIRAAVGR
jgi:hypothetical protein